MAATFIQVTVKNGKFSGEPNVPIVINTARILSIQKLRDGTAGIAIGPERSISTVETFEDVANALSKANYVYKAAHNELSSDDERDAVFSSSDATS